MTATGVSRSRCRKVWRSSTWLVSGASCSQLPGCGCWLARISKLPSSRVLDLGVVQVPGAAGDAVLRGEVLVLRREAHVVDAAAPAADPIRVLAGDRRPEVVVVRVVEPHLHELGHGAEHRVQRPRQLAEGLRARAQQAQQIAVALGAIEARAGEAVTQERVAGLLEQLAELGPRLRAVDLAGPDRRSRCVSFRFRRGRSARCRP